MTIAANIPFRRGKTDVPINGICDPKFEAVREAFAANFAQRGEPGASVAISIGGRPVVDLWGGHADIAQTREWQRDTLVNFFSVSKALCAISACRLVERGHLDLDALVAKLWPEFAQAGKETITPRQVLSHQAGLPAIAEPLPDGAAIEWQTIIHALEKQSPWWTPGTAHGYHVNTFGFLVGEIVRRASGMSIGQFVQREIAEPLGADFYIGVPQAEHHRIAEYRWPGTSPIEQGDASDPMSKMRWNAYFNPPGFSGAHWVNRAQWREAEVPSTNGHGNARSVARLYSALAHGGAIDGVRILSESMLREATTEHSHGEDLVSQRPARFGIGFQLTQVERPLGPNPRAFGHFGAGGSLGFCDPDMDMAFGYVTNDMGPRWQNPRNRALIEAVYSSI
jgi:CubicO group peptidase (beta-lactamase class C family)